MMTLRVTKKKTFLNIFDWGYKNLLPKDTYVLIEPFIEKG